MTTPRFLSTPYIAWTVLGVLFLLGLYAPLLASSQPLIAIYEGHIYFPLFRMLLFKGFYTKEIDLFFNALMFTFPLIVLLIVYRRSISSRYMSLALLSLLALQGGLFLVANTHLIRDPRAHAVSPSAPLASLSPYAKLEKLVEYKLHLLEHERLTPYRLAYERRNGKSAPTLYGLYEKERVANLQQLHEEIALADSAQKKRTLEVERTGILAKEEWLKSESAQLFTLFTPFRPYHWEEDAGGSELFNQVLPFYEVTRPNRKDLMASLLFGIRLSIVVGVMATALAIAIGIPFGLLSGYLGGKVDLLLFRILEIWESMPSFFMLLLIIAITHVKSIFIVILTLALFGWTGFARFIRAETLRERSKAYVMAAHSLGFGSMRILFAEILPNAAFPLFALLPFSMMGAIAAEAGLSFLGLGEENSASLGVLMSEGRTFFPGESYLLWPPACIISLLLICFALIGDDMRNRFDPRIQSTDLDK